MRLPIWLLLLVPLLRGTTATCLTTNQYVPGADIIQSGFDRTQLSTAVERAFRSKIFNCSNLISSSGINVVKEIEYDSLYTYYYQYIEITASFYTASVGVGTSNFGASINYHQDSMTSYMLLQNTYAAQGFSLYAQYIEALVLPPAYILPLDPIFKMSLDMLPSTIVTESDNDMYIQFIEGYGTDYITHLSMGGGFRLNYYVDSEYIHETSYEETMHQMSVGFSATIFNMQMGYASNSSEYQNSEEFIAHSYKSLLCMGGDPELECSSQEWMLSIPKFQTYIDLQYAPLWMLVYDDDDKRDTLKQKTDDYARTGILC